MKRALIITLLLAALAAGCLCFAHGEINSARDRTELTEKTVYGDVSAAEGLKVRSRYCFDDRLFWDVDYSAGEAPSIDTEFHFSQKRVFLDPPHEYYGVELESGISYGMSFGSDEDMSRPQSGIAEAYRQLFNETPAGEEREKTVYIKDYYDYYPMGLYFDLPGFSYYWSEENPESEADIGNELLKEFRDYFKIPVLENERLKISISKYEDGSLSGTGCSPEDGGDAYYLWSRSAVTREDCFFTVEVHSQNGVLMDISRLPDGYGIYRLPYSCGEADEKRQQLPKLGPLSMVYPLDPETEILSFLTNEEQTRLLLLTAEQGKCLLTVIDAATMETLQSLPLAELGESLYVWQVFSYQDFMALSLSDGRIIVAEVNEAGEYELRIDAMILERDDPLFSLKSDTVMAWDGERLAISDFLESHAWISGVTCDYYIAVCDRDGLLYYGEYENNLSSDLADGYYNCRPVNAQPLEISW